MGKFTIHGNYYNNCFNLPPTTGPDACDIFIEKTCPADIQTTLWKAPVSLNDLDAIVESAVKGISSWRKTTLEDRIAIIERYKNELSIIKNELIEAICYEVGKPKWSANIEVDKTIAHISVLIDYAKRRISPATIHNDDQKYAGTISYKPIGPVLIISPFDYPCQIPSNRIVSALLGGNSVILKPSEQSVYTSQLIISALHRAGFPNGVINMVIGGEEVGKRLVKYKEIIGVLFIGSNETGGHLLDSASSRINKMLSLELSGKNTTILHKDCNVDSILDAVIHSCYACSGQDCLSTAIVAIHKNIEDEFITKFHQRSKEIVVDHPFEFESGNEPFMGPLINEQAVKTYLLFIGMAKREGITEIMRGKQLERKKRGHYVSPSIHYTKKLIPQSLFLGSEILSPNCTIIPYQEAEEAINIANSTEFGLATSLFSNTKEMQEICLRDIHTGSINFNVPTTTLDPRFPIGSLKNSSNFRTGGIGTLDSCVFPVSNLSRY